MREERRGASSLAEALSGISFPISKRDLMECFGDNEFEVEEGKMMRVRDAISDCPHESYSSMEDILTCPPVEKKLKAA